MKLFLLINIFFLLFASNICADEIKTEKTEEKEIKGKVVDEFGEPFAGVIVESKESPKFTITDSDGKYSIRLPEDSQLVFKFLENTSDTISTAYRTIVNYKLVVDIN